MLTSDPPASAPSSRARATLSSATCRARASARDEAVAPAMPVSGGAPWWPTAVTTSTGAVHRAHPSAAASSGPGALQGGGPGAAAPGTFGPSGPLALLPMALPDALAPPEGADPQQERWLALLGAVARLGGDLELRAVLQRIVDASRALVGARWAALGVLGQDGCLEELITSGMTETEVARIDRPACGLGVLAEMVRHPRPLRLDDLREHPAFVGFPPGHPVMRSFLGVPLSTGDEVFGNLYLTDRDGPDGQVVSFTEADEQVVRALAAAAGAAVANAHLYEQSLRRQGWLRATATASRALVPSGRAAGARQVAAAARTAAVARGVVLLLPAAGGALPVVEAVDGSLGLVGGDELPLSLVGEHLEPGGPPLAPASPALAQHLGVGHGARAGSALVCRVDPRQGRRTVGAPPDDPSTVGLLVLVWDGKQAASVLAHDAADVVAFADRVALALEVSRAQAYRARLAVFEDRDRIARDLHDLVIQRLFAVGMSLQAVERQVPGAAGQRVRTAVDDLDETIDEVRRTIFSLHARPGAGHMRADVEHEVLQATGHLGFAPAQHLSGALEDLPWALRADVLAVLREALSNTARHAGASAVDVSLAVGDVVEVTVRDDGRGLGRTGRRSGLANLERRAVARGGSLEVGPAPGGGTVVRWSAPAT